MSGKEYKIQPYSDSSFDNVPLQTRINRRRLQPKPKSPPIFNPYLEDGEGEEIDIRYSLHRKGKSVVSSEEDETSLVIQDNEGAFFVDGASSSEDQEGNYFPPPLLFPTSIIMLQMKTWISIGASMRMSS